MLKIQRIQAWQLSWIIMVPPCSYLILPAFIYYTVTFELMHWNLSLNLWPFFSSPRQHLMAAYRSDTNLGKISAPTNGGAQHTWYGLRMNNFTKIQDIESQEKRFWFILKCLQWEVPFHAIWEFSADNSLLSAPCKPTVALRNRIRYCVALRVFKTL